MNRFPLLLTAFVCGGAALALELTASRLLAPAFGTSMPVWSAIISSTMVYLALGYWLGGRLADQRPEPRLLFQIIGAAAAFTALIPVFGAPLVSGAALATAQLSPGGIAGSFVVLLLLFAAPVTLLGAVSPFVLRLCIERAQEAGTVAGRVSALSTLGSLFGALLPALVLVPALGTRGTFVVIAATLAAVAVTGLAALRRGGDVLAVLVVTGACAGAAGRLVGQPILSREHLLVEVESPYNYIQVTDTYGARSMRLNEPNAVHSVYHPDRLFSGSVWDYASFAPAFAPEFAPPRVQRIAILGGGTGTQARQLSATYPGVHIDLVELDPELRDLALQHFGVAELPGVHPVAMDARQFLAASDRRYDLIIVDAYQVPYIPFHLATAEFFALVASHLEPTGAIMVNSLRIRQAPELLDALCATVATALPSVYVVDVLPAGERGTDVGNSLVFATRSSGDLADLRRNVHLILAPRGASKRDAKLFAGVRSKVRDKARDCPGGDRVLTDDHAPVEWLVHESWAGFLSGS